MNNSALRSDRTRQKIPCVLNEIDANSQENESNERPKTAGTAGIYPNSRISITIEIYHSKENPFSIILQVQIGQPI
jgi:hypothetical protein